MELWQANSAGRPNVSLILVQRLWDQYEFEDSVSRRCVTCETRSYDICRNHFLALSARKIWTNVSRHAADQFLAPGRRISVTTSEGTLQCWSLFKATICVSPKKTTEKNPLFWARQLVFWTRKIWDTLPQIHTEVQLRSSDVLEETTYQIPLI